MPHSMYKCVAQLALAFVLSVGSLSGALAEEGAEISTQFKDWTVTCAGEGDERRCAMVQLLRQEDQDQPFLRVELAAAPSGGLSGVVITPFGLDIGKGISLSIDGGERWNLPFRTCQNIGCVVHLSVGVDIVERMKDGERLEVFLFRLDQAGSLNVSVSLTGFTAAHGAL